MIKILATTLGETGGDALSMSMDLGYLVSTAIFAVIFLLLSVLRYPPSLITLRCIGSRSSQPPR
ncbi:hypothetical protein ACSZNK_20670 [Aeromonas hydrophila]